MTPPIATEESTFLTRLRLATYVLVLLVLTIYLLREFRSVLQPFSIALFLVFLIHPIHHWLVKHGIPSLPAYGVIIAIVALCVTGFGTLMYANITEVASNLHIYEERLEKKILDLMATLPFAVPNLEGHFLRNIVDAQQLAAGVGAAVGQFGDFTSWAALTFVYLFFMVAEKVGFPHRLARAFGDTHGEHIMSVIESITLAIGQYVAVKTLVSAMAGVLSYIVLVIFGVEFAVTWGILIFLLNYIPYLGCIIAVSLPILLSLVQFDEIWKSIVLTIALVGVQQIIGIYIEPRMAGQRLDVSPLLIVLSLAFWGVVWGIVGMILAVPLLVIARIVLDSINETKPIARLISNR